MIEQLTPEHEKLIDIIVEQYKKNALGGDDSYNLEIIEKSLSLFYELSGLKKFSEIVVCTSPLDMRIKAGLSDGETYDYFGCGYDSHWTAFYDYMEQIGVEYDANFYFTEWKDFILKSGVFATCLFENIAYICIRPCEVHRQDSGNLHNENGMAIKWRDGYGEYALNGVIVSEEIVMVPADQLSCKLVLTEKNAEIRREIIRKIGMTRIIEELGAKSIDTMEGRAKEYSKRFGKHYDNEYELLNFDCIDGRYRPFLKIVNSSIGIYHIEGVHPDCQTVDQALGFRNPFVSEKEWKKKNYKYTQPKKLT